MFYSNSNIDTRDEFERRLESARRVADAEGVEIVADAYDHDRWLREVAAGFESEPEKGARCERCFRFSLRRAAEFAAARGCDGFATSLTVSPHKPSAVVFAAGDDAAASVAGAPPFLHEDFKKRGGFLESTRRAAELGLYRQSYCGCEFSRRGRKPEGGAA